MSVHRYNAYKGTKLLLVAIDVPVENKPLRGRLVISYTNGNTKLRLVAMKPRNRCITREVGTSSSRQPRINSDIRYISIQILNDG